MEKLKEFLNEYNKLKINEKLYLVSYSVKDWNENGLIIKNKKINISEINIEDISKVLNFFSDIETIDKKIIDLYNQLNDEDKLDFIIDAFVNIELDPNFDEVLPLKNIKEDFNFLDLGIQLLKIKNK